MRVYILTYSSKTFFSKDKRVSGIDASCLAQYNSLVELGHEVGMYSAFTDLHEHYKGIDFYRDDIKTSKEAKEYYSKNRKEITEHLIKSIAEFEPDIILSNHELYKPVYSKIINLNIPCVYISHCRPGFFSDLNNANMLHEFSEIGNSITCVSAFHKEDTIKYYKKGRSIWEFNSIIPDHILFSQYSEQQDVLPADGIVRHVSAASKDKKTMHILDMYENSEVYTTINFLGGKMDDYIKNALDKHSDKIHLDIDHSEIMKNVAKSTATFVALAPFDTFTITSLESLSRGVPLIIMTGKDNRHPAREMIEPHLVDKYIKRVRTKKEFEGAVEYFSTFTIDDRKQLRDSVMKICSKETYKYNIQAMLDRALHKYENRNFKNFLGI